ncbi:hypothetical protein MUB52_18330 [Roseobacter sp. WL0113]|uniref:Secreted protein n=1 Tax=Roseobacter sinensis TaxID=2931391 RepID=A0ABT3BIJ7_9RHOB|nr:hypothetical protein [Roseobacter sp. WL0113]
MSTIASSVAIFGGIRRWAAATPMVRQPVGPCTGTIVLLVVARQTDTSTVEAVAAIEMGRGTAILTRTVVVSGSAARRATRLSTDWFGAIALALPAIQGPPRAAIIK